MIHDERARLSQCGLMRPGQTSGKARLCRAGRGVAAVAELAIVITMLILLLLLLHGLLLRCW